MGSDIRIKLVNAVYDHSSDELEILDLLNIAKSSDEQLIDRLINILEWYANEHNNS
jgi:hypothetical protein